MRRKSKKFIFPILAILLLFAALAAALIAASAKNKAKSEHTQASAPPVSASISQSEQPQPEKEPEPSKVHFMAAGDNLIHDNIYKQAAARANGNGFDFTLPYQYISPLFEKADIAFINQETIIAESIYELSGYPLFNSPAAVGDKLVDIGFNVVTVANNHMFDMGEKGLIAALDYWQSKADSGVLAMGAWRSEADMQKPITYEKNGITFGFVPITEHTNGLKLPKDTELRFVRSDEYDLMEQQIELAKANSDFVVVSIHWGTENSTSTNDNQLYLSQMFADMGVDLVLGHHSHTLQPMEWRTGKSGNKTLVVYSLGNFISSMLDPQNMLGGILDIDITKSQGGEAEITRAKMIPIVTQYDTTNRRNVRIYPFSDYTEELLAAHGMKQWHDNFSVSYMQNIINKNIPAEFLD